MRNRIQFKGIKNVKRRAIALGLAALTAFTTLGLDANILSARAEGETVSYNVTSTASGTGTSGSISTVSTTPATYSGALTDATTIYNSGSIATIYSYSDGAYRTPKNISFRYRVPAGATVSRQVFVYQNLTSSNPESGTLVYQTSSSSMSAMEGKDTDYAETMTFASNVTYLNKNESVAFVVSFTSSESITVYMGSAGSNAGNAYATSVNDGYTNLSGTFVIAETNGGAAAPSDISSVTLSESSVVLDKTQTHTLTATITPALARDITFASDAPSVAEVSDAGLITPKAAGTANINVTAGGKMATCSVTVIETTVSDTTYAGAGVEAKGKVTVSTGSATYTYNSSDSSENNDNTNTYFTTSYANDTAVGTASVTVTGKGTLSGYSVTKEYKIEKYTIPSSTSVLLTNVNTTTNTVNDATITADGRTLVLNEDVTLTLSEKDTSAGNGSMTYTVTITGINNCEGEATTTATYAVSTDGTGKIDIADIAELTDLDSANPIYFDPKANDTTAYEALKEKLYATLQMIDINTGNQLLDFSAASNLTSNAYGITLSIADSFYGKAGIYTVTATANSPYYTGTISYDVEIEPLSIKGNEKIAVTLDGTDATSYSALHTGSQIAPEVDVTYDGAQLTKDTDYTVSYSNSVNVGTAKVTIKGIGNYSSNISYDYNIVADFTKDVSVTFTNKGYATTNTADKNVYYCSDYTRVYSGSAYQPAITVKVGDDTLVKNTDYQIEYSGTDANHTLNVTDAGTAYFRITGLGDYKNDANVIYGSFTITPKSLETTPAKVTVAAGVTRTYDGTEQTLTAGTDFTVKDGNKTLAADKDYEVSYTNNTDAGTATLTVTGTGNYKDSVSTTFTINPMDISAATSKDAKSTTTDASLNITSEKVVMRFDNGTSITVTKLYSSSGSDIIKAYDSGNAITLTDGGDYAVVFTDAAGTSHTLSYGTDFTTSYENNTKLKSFPATAVMSLSGMGNFTGDLESDADISYTITAETIEALIVVVNEGNSSAEQIFSGGTLSADVINYAYTHELVFNNMVQTPTVSIYYNDQNGTALKPTEDYDITYANAKNASSGSATGTITIKGIESGDHGLSSKESIVITYKINSRDISNATVTATVSGGTPTFTVVDNTLPAGDKTLAAVSYDTDGTTILSGDYILATTADFSTAGAGKSITLTGIKNYTGTLTTTVDIGIDLSTAIGDDPSATTNDVYVSFSGATWNATAGTYEVPYFGDPVASKFKLINKSTTAELVKDTDYTISFSPTSNTKYGDTVTVTINGIGAAYYGTREFTYVIGTNSDLSGLRITDGYALSDKNTSTLGVKSFTFNGTTYSYAGATGEPLKYLYAGKDNDIPFDLSMLDASGNAMSDISITSVTVTNGLGGETTFTGGSGEIPVTEWIEAGSLSDTGITTQTGYNFYVTFTDESGNYGGTTVEIPFRLVTIDLSGTLAEVGDSFTIAQGEDTAANELVAISWKNDEKDYDGTVYTPTTPIALTVTYGNATASIAVTKTVNATIYFTTRYYTTTTANTVEPKNAGTYYLQITAASGFNITGTAGGYGKEMRLVINRRKFTDETITIDGVSTQAFKSRTTPTSGVEIAGITVTDSGTNTTIPTTDYTITYTDNTTPATAAKVTVTYTGNDYEQTAVSKNFVITGDFSGENGVITDSDNYDVSTKTYKTLYRKGTALYTDKGCTTAFDPNSFFTLKVKSGDSARTEKEITSSYYEVNLSEDFYVPGADKVITVSGTGIYAGSTLTFTGIKVYGFLDDTANVTISGITNQSYTGTTMEPTVTVKYDTATLVRNTDYSMTVLDDGNNPFSAKAGKKIVTITECSGGYYLNTVTDDYLVRYNLDDAVVTFNVDKLGAGTSTWSSTDTAREVSYTELTGLTVSAVTIGDQTININTDYTVAYLDTNGTELTTSNTSATVVAALKEAGKGTYRVRLSAVEDSTTITGGPKYVTFTVTAGKIAEKSGPSSGVVKEYTGSTITFTKDDFGDMLVFAEGDTVKNATSALTYGTDYTVTTNAIDAQDEAVYTITGAGNYTGTVTGKFKITEKDINDASIIISDIANVQYTGSPVEPEIKVTDNTRGVTLTRNTDYTATGYTGSNTNPGTVTVTFTGIGNYTGMVTKTFEITKLNFSDGKSIEVGTTSVPYTGQYYNVDNLDLEIYPLNADGTRGTKLTASAYAVSFNPLPVCEAGSYTVTITPTDTTYYDGEYQTTFTVEQRSLTNNTDISVALDETAWDYAGGSSIEPAITSATDKGRKNTGGSTTTVSLTEGTDYTVTYENNREATDAAYVVLTGTGNYTGECKVKFTIGEEIKEFTTSGYDNTAAKSFTYDGSTHEPVVASATSASGESLTSNYYTTSSADKDATSLSADVGDKVITLTGTNGYYGTLTQEYKVVACDLEAKDVTAALSADTFTYTGSAITPTVTVTETKNNASGNTLVEGQDYTVSYTSNTNAGKAKAIITAKDGGNYTFDPITKEFTIAPLDISNGSLSMTSTGANAYRNGYDYTGSAIKPDESFEVSNGTAYLTLTKNTDYRVTYQSADGGTDITKPGAKVLTITAADGGNYTGTYTQKYYIYGNLAGSSPTASVSIGDQFYTGTVITPSGDDITLSLGDLTGLTLYDDNSNTTGAYSIGNVTSNNAWAIGSTVTVELDGVEANYYYGTTTGTFKISMDESKISVYYTDEPQDSKTKVADSTGVFSYTGSDVKPGFTLMSGTTDLSTLGELTVDYTVLSGDGVSAGSEVNALVTLILNDSNGTTITLTPHAGASDVTVDNTAVSYTIGKKNLADDDVNIVMNTTSASYTGKEISPNISIIYNGSLLSKGTDYAVDYQNNIYPGTATANITGIGNFYTEDGGVDKDYTIKMTKVSNLTATADGTSKLVVSYTRAAGANHYRILVKDASGNTVKNYSTTGTAATVLGLSGGTDYTVTVYAYPTSADTDAGEGVSTAAATAAISPALTSATSLISGQVNVSWASTGGYDGVEIERKKAGGSFVRIADEPLSYGTTFIDKTAASGVTYTYRVRGYKVVNGAKQVASSYSDTITITVK